MTESMLASCLQNDGLNSVFHKIQATTSHPLHKTLSNKESIPKSYLFEALILLWLELFALIVVVIFYSKPVQYYTQQQWANRDSITPIGIAMFCVVLSVPMAMIALAAATRVAPRLMSDRIGDAKNCARCARIFVLTSWIAFVVVCVVLNYFK